MQNNKDSKKIIVPTIGSQTSQTRKSEKNAVWINLSLFESVVYMLLLSMFDIREHIYW